MDRLTAAAAVTLAMAAAAQAQPLRLVTFETTRLPRVVAVLDNAPGQPIKSRDFQLVEDGARTAAGVRTLKLRDTDTALAVVVAVDVSGSMRGAPLTAIKQGIASLVSRKRDRDRVAVLSFADDFRWEAGWNAGPADIVGAFQGLDIRGTRTRLYDAVAASLDQLAVRQQADPAFPSRHLILLISDGHDEGSTGTRADLESRVHASRARLDAVGLARLPAWLKNLESLSQAGFGEFRTTSTASGLTALLETGAEGVLDSPVVEFTATTLRADGRNHQLGVRHQPTDWSAQVAVTLSGSLAVQTSRSWRDRMGLVPWWAYAVAALICALGFLFVAARTRRSPPRPALHPSQPLPVPRDSGVSTSQRSSGAPLNRPVTRRPETAASAPFRAATVLAPDAGTATCIMGLAFTGGPYTGNRFSLDGRDVWIGANPGNQVCLATDPAVSGHHACISREGQFYRLRDNGSLNHTWLNGRQVIAPTLLQAGDRIRVGQSECTFDRIA